MTTDLIATLLGGVSHQRAGRPDLAEAVYRGVLQRDPAQPNALYLYGLLQLRDGRAAAAADMLATAAGQRDDPDTHLHLARARLAANDPANALVAVDDALARDAPRAEALYLRGTALNALGRPDAAIPALAEAALLNPAHAATRLNLGNAHAELDRWDDAEHHIRAAIRLDPALVEAHASLGHLLGARGQLTEAAAACEAAIALQPHGPEAHWNLATILLLGGDYRRGFNEYEWHRRHPLFKRYWRELPGPAWLGGPLDGQTLLVHAGQGMGDTIQLARYMPHLAARGARVVLVCATALVPLLSDQPGLSNVVPRSDPLPPYDLWVDQMSLPRLLGTEATAISGSEPYLQPDRARARAWAERLNGIQDGSTKIGSTRIGFAWAGNPAHANDRRRSLPLPIAQQLAHQLAQQPARPGMISLQHGPRAPEAAALGLRDNAAALTDYAETAALIASLDLVVTVDTSVAHLAGALGVPAWVMLPAAPDWRWLLSRDDTPWYRSLRLFRQPSPGDWAPVVHAITAELDAGLRPP